MKVLLLDPSVSSANLGDEIIAEAVSHQIRNIFPECRLSFGLTQDPFGTSIRDLHNGADLTFVGGTNLLSSEMDKYAQWKISLKKGAYLSGVILFGVGWWQYQSSPNKYTAKLLKKALHPKILHSVRDGYTVKQLAAAGIYNVINTACPTMWSLSSLHCQKIPSAKAKNVIFTLTDYNRDVFVDRAMVIALSNNYNKVFFWPQGINDIEYLRELGVLNNSITLLSPSLNAYRKVLEDSSLSLDYVGTRLHAGIYALKYFRRTLIFSVDNRALEMAADFSLPVLKRSDVQQLQSVLCSNIITSITLPVKEIEEWRKQFEIKSSK